MSLGALGGGGSILTVPALVYLLHQNAHAATTASLIIVGLTALAGAIGHWRAGRVRAGAGAVFGLLGIAGSYAGSRASAAVSQHVLLVAFAVLMVIAAVAMLRRRSIPGSGDARAAEAPEPPPPARAAPPYSRTALLTRPAAAVITAMAPRWKSYAKVVAAATVVGL